MIGTNTINLNQETLRLALQHYFDTVLFQRNSSPTIVNVLHNTYTIMTTQVVIKDTNAKDK